MQNKEETTRNIAVLIFLCIVIPAAAVFVLNALIQGIAIGLIVAAITFILFVYLSKVEGHATR